MKLLIVLLALASTLCFGQETFQSAKVRDSILMLTSQIPHQYDSFTFLTYLDCYDTIFLKPTPNELYELTNHPNPLVRRSVFHLMLSHSAPKAFDLLEKNPSDTTQWFYIQRYSAKPELQTFADEILFYLSLLSGWNDSFKFTPTQSKIAMAMIKRREVERKIFFTNH